jgi:hypothetical protein
LLKVASSAFAWKYTQLRLDRTPRHPVGLAPTNLLYHARVSLYFCPSRRAALTDQDLDDLLAAGLNLFELDASDCNGMRLESWTRILSDPSMQQLRVLHMQKAGLFRSLDAGVVKLVAALPHLHTLSAQSWGDASVWPGLAAAPSLTSLRVADSGARQYEHNAMDAVATFPHLRVLEVDLPCLWGSKFRSFFSGPHTHTLESLTLSRFSAHTPLSPPNWSTRGCEPIPVEDYAAAFKNLESLTTLVLKTCRHISNILPQLIHASALKLLVIEPHCDAVTFDYATTAPSSAELIALMTARPQLRCVLRVGTRASGLHTGAVLAFNAAVCAAVGQRFILAKEE